jgi:hypothetical protein
MDREIKFQISNIDVLEAVLNPQDKSLEENQVFNYDINLEHKLNTPEQALIIICSVIINNKDKSGIFGKFTAGCIFYIENFEDFVVEDDENIIDLPDNFIVSLNSITISTVRGMMAGFYRGTYLHNAILPMINPASFSKKKAQ